MEAFVVRLWSPTEGREPVVRGTALHVASGAAAVFSDPEGLIDFLSTGLNRQGAPDEPEASQVPDRGLLDP